MPVIRSNPRRRTARRSVSAGWTVWTRAVPPTWMTTVMEAALPGRAGGAGGMYKGGYVEVGPVPGAVCEATALTAARPGTGEARGGLRIRNPPDRCRCGRYLVCGLVARACRASSAVAVPTVVSW